MTTDGYVVAGCDGRIPQGGIWNLLHKPFLIGGFRPDVWGVSPTTGGIAFGEAKTALDVLNKHSRMQVSTFAQVLQKNSSSLSVLYIAVPESATQALGTLLRSVNIETRTNIYPICVPDCLLTTELEEYYENA